MVDDERITYGDIIQKGINVTRIIVKKENNKNAVFVEMEDKAKRQIGENLDTVFLYGVRSSPEAGGPFFIAVIEECILSVYEEILYKVTPPANNMRIYVPIW